MSKKSEELELELLEALAQADSVSAAPSYYIKEFCECYARWLECEEKNTALGLIAKHPSGAAVESPYVKIGLEYMREANEAWEKIQGYLEKSNQKSIYNKFMEDRKNVNSKSKHQ